MSRILVIDDDPEMRVMLEQMLKTAGHDVVSVADGIQAIDMMNPFQIKPARVIIRDIFMPGKGGIEVITDLRGRFPEVAIIAMSGKPYTQNSLAFDKRLGAGKNLEKPFQPQELLALVEEVLRPKS